MESAVEGTIKWLDCNQTAEKEEFEHKRQELESLCSPIITRIYQQEASGQDGGFGGTHARNSAISQHPIGDASDIQLKWTERMQEIPRVLRS